MNKAHDAMPTVSVPLRGEPAPSNPPGPILPANIQTVLAAPGAVLGLVARRALAMSAMAERYTIAVDDIEIGERHRALSEDAVQRLAVSMNDIGLRSPISIRILDEMEIAGAVVHGVPVLVAGAHRLAAAKELGWSHIDCVEVDDDPLMAELWEIAENLYRCDLTKDQRDAHIRRYAELLSERGKIVPQTAEQMPVTRGRPKSITTQVAEATGLSDDTVRRALKPKPTAVPEPPLGPDDAYNRWAGQMGRVWGSASREWRTRWAADDGELRFN